MHTFGSEQVDMPAGASMGPLFDRAQQVLVSGVGRSLGINHALGRPLFIQRAHGSRLVDTDGREYIDLCMSHGAVLHGHGDPDIQAAVLQALELGAIVGYETPYHAQLAELLVQTVPCAELVRFANSGTEATQLAVRLARGQTGREKLIKFVGHFHGLHDYLLYNIHGGTPRAEADSYAGIIPTPESAGMPRALDNMLFVLPWNDLPALQRVVDQHGHEIAAIIMEPVNYTSGCILPVADYLQAVRLLCQEAGIVLIFDEVLSAYRMGPHCAQGYFGITPDICTISKAIGNGIPLSAVAGRREIMQHFAPSGRVAQGGTFTGHLAGVLAGIASLRKLSRPGYYEHLYQIGDRLLHGLAELFAEYGLLCHVQGLGARFGLYFGLGREVQHFAEASAFNRELANTFARACIRHGVYVHTYTLTLGHYGFSASHTADEVDEVLRRVRTALADMVARREFIPQRKLEPTCVVYPPRQSTV